MNLIYQLKEIWYVLKAGGTPGYLLIIYFVVQIVFARTKSDMAAVDASAAIFAAYAIGCAIYSWKVLKDDYGRIFNKAILRNSPVFYFILFTFLCFISSMWSPNPILSAYRAVECIGMLMLNMAAVKTLFENEEEDQILQWSAAYGFIVVALQFWKGARLSIDFGLYTVQFPATIFFYLAFYFAPNKIARYSVLLAAFFCNSTTGYMGIALGLISFLFGEKKYRLMGYLFSVLIIASVFMYGSDRVLNETVFSAKKGVMVNGQIDDTKTSGRTKIWEEAIQKVKTDNREWYGYGFVVGEMVFVRKLIGNQVIGMHNGFLSAYVGTGIVGFFLFTIFMLKTIILLLRNTIPKRYRAVLIASMCVVVVHTLGNPGLGFRVYGTWMPAMFIIILICAFDLYYKEQI